VSALPIPSLASAPKTLAFRPVRGDLRDARRIILKVGTGIVTDQDGQVCTARLRQILQQVAGLQAQGRQVILVSSGSVGVGTNVLSLRRPLSVVDRQAAAAAGQSLLMRTYLEIASELGLSCAQILLGEDDFSDRSRHVHLTATLERLLKLGALPIVNENDAVTTSVTSGDGGAVFSDNDRLAALTASALTADALLLLTDVEGVLSSPPGTPGSRRLAVYHPDESVQIGAASSMGRGGIAAKISAARLGAQAGVNTVIASGILPDTIRRVCAGEDVGTWFRPESPLSGKHRWLAWATAPVGRIFVNDGAKQALVERRASLLRPGIVKVEGHFPEASVVSLCDEFGIEFARGHCDVPAPEVLAEDDDDGDRSRPVVHADHLVILPERETHAHA